MDFKFFLCNNKMPVKYSRRTSLKKSLKKRKSLKRKSFKRRTFRRRKNLRGGASELQKKIATMNKSIQENNHHHRAEFVNGIPTGEIEERLYPIHNVIPPRLQEEFDANRQSKIDARNYFQQKLEQIKENDTIEYWINIVKSSHTGDDLRNVGLDHPARNNKEVLLASVQNNGESLRFASNELKSDPDVVRAAIQNNPKALKYASGELISDKNFILSVVRIDGMLLKYFDPVFRSDEEVVLAAVENNGLALQFASEELRKDEDILYDAVLNNGNALWYVPPELYTSQIDVVGTAVYDSRHPIDYNWFGDLRDENVPQELLREKTFILGAVRHDGMNLELASPELRADPEVILAAIKQNPEAERFALKESDINPSESAASLSTGISSASPRVERSSWFPDPLNWFKS